jgi:hypothetical protein
MTYYKILGSQILLKDEELKKHRREEVQNIILGFANDVELDYNLRADASDTLMNTGDEVYVDKAREIIIELGKHFGKVRTVFDNAQNVHVDSIEKSILEALEFLSTVETLNIGTLKDKKYIDYGYIISKINNILDDKKVSNLKADLEMYETEISGICSYCDKNIYGKCFLEKDEKKFCDSECVEGYNYESRIKVSLNRVYIDRALYSKYNLSLNNILVKIWSYMSSHDSFEDMKIRLLEELYDMSGTCSSGFASRLINVISGYGDFSIRISWDEQIVANFTGRLNALARKITDKDSKYYTDKHRDVIELYLRSIGRIKTRKEAKDLESKEDVNTVIDDFLSENRQQKIELAVEEFASNVLFEMTLETEDYISRQNFSKFFRDHMLDIREELYQEFKDHITDTEFDLASRKAIASYEGLKHFI